MLDPIDDLKVSGSQYRRLQSKLRKCMDMLQANHLFDKCDFLCYLLPLCVAIALTILFIYSNSTCSLDERFTQLKAYMHQELIRKSQDAVVREIKAAEGLILEQELTQRMRVLRRLGYMDESGIVTQKGHVRFPQLCSCCRPVKVHVGLADALVISCLAFYAVSACAIFNAHNVLPACTT